MRKFCLLLALLMCCVAGRTALATNYASEGTCTVDGNLSEWADATWIDLGTVADPAVGNPATDLTDAKFAVRWSPDTNLIYVAVTGTDMVHVFADASANIGVWNTTDTVEVYVDAADLNKANYSFYGDTTQSLWKYAQQYCAGLKTDGSVWAAIAGQNGYTYDGVTTYTTEAIASGIVNFAASVNGDSLNYEFAIKPYKFFDISNPSASIVKTLSGGDVIGLDVDITTYDSDSAAYAVIALDATANKYLNAVNIGSITLVGADTHGTFPEFVKIGDAGNAADAVPLYGYDKTAKGAVAYEYYIGKFEITAAQYAAFLNSVATVSDTHALLNTSSTLITRTTNLDGTYTYSVNPGYADRPMGYMTWASAARYCNWLTNGGTSTSSTETGVYVFKSDGTYGGCFRTYNPPTTTDGLNRALISSGVPAYWIPNMNEYYKAAYYNPATLAYYDYPNSTDTAPASPYFDGTNSGNWRYNNVLAIGVPYYYSEVGTYENSKSPYGCYDMLGNVWEWTEDFLWGAWSGSTHYYGPTYHGGSYYSNTALYCQVNYFSGYVASGTSANVYGTTIANGDQGVRICCNQAAVDARAAIPGDFNNDDVVNAADIDLLYAAIAAGNTASVYDLNKDGSVTSADATYLVGTILGTYFGDANLDKSVNVSDLSLLAANYGTTSGAGWAMGDFTGDGAVNVSDLSLLAANYGSGSSSTLSWADAYAQAFDTTSDADDASDDAAAEDTTTSSACSSLGLTLIAGLALMGLMIVKLDE